MGKQFDKVSCKYGAPMGRDSYGSVFLCAPRSVRLFKVVINQGYDDGGAYWGNPTSYKDILYCAVSTDNEYREFVRASSRYDAAMKLEIPMNYLIQPVKEKKCVL